MMTKEQLASLKVGDEVVRLVAGVIPMPLKITAIDTSIWCGPWEFHKDTGAEIDADCGWDGLTETGSFLIPKEE